MSMLEDDDLPAPKGAGDRVFRFVVVSVVLGGVIGLPVATWVGKKFFGWTPPPIVEKILKMVEVSP